MIKKNLIFFMPFMVGGGVEKNLYIVSNYCAKRIRNVYLISSTKSFNKNFKKVKIINPSFKIWKFFSPRLNYLICLFVLFKMLIKNKNSLVFSFQANIYCIVLCKLIGVKIITRSNTSPSGWPQGIIKSFLFKNILKLADTTIVNSLDFKKEMYKKFCVNATCVYNPLEKKKIINFSRKKKKINFFKDRKFLKIINIARFTDQKDHITLLKAINFLKNTLKVKLIIIGKGPCENQMRNFIAKNNLEKNVKIINYTKNPYTYLKQSNLFVLSSKFEGLPNVLLESLVLKKFVISSDCPTGPKEILLGNKGGLLFKTGDYKDLSKKIIFFIKNKNICNKKLKLAIKNLDRFDYNKNIKKYFYLVEKKL